MKKVIAWAVLSVTAIAFAGLALLGLYSMALAAIHGNYGAQLGLDIVGCFIGVPLLIWLLEWAVHEVSQ